MVRAVTLLVLATCLLACSSRPGETDAGPSAPAAESRAPDGAAPASSVAGENALERARGAVGLLGGTLKKRLIEVLATEGAVAAARVCGAEAQEIGAGVAETAGVRVGRSSLRLRNPRNAAPAWVGRWLEERGERSASGVTGFDRIESGPEGEVARVLRPLAVEAPCVLCHGPRESLLPEIKGLLAERYPEDSAVGYAVGDLRGVAWAEAPVER